MNIDLENLINNSNDSFSTNSFELAGGKNQEWKQIIESICQRHVKHHNPQMSGEDMGDLEYVKKFNRLNCPITLIPQ